MKKIRSIVQQIKKLKPMPQIVHKILAIQQDPEGSMDDLAKVVAHDATTTANLLKAANSAYYGRSIPFDSVQQATVFLGMDEVVDLVLLSNCAANLNQAHNGYGLDGGELWRYSVASALIAKDLCLKMGVTDTHRVFTSALLKDIGKVVLEQYVASSSEEINMLVEKERLSFQEAEKLVIGIDHAELGALTAEVWRFSPEMVDIIKHHHQPAEAKIVKQEATVVHLSDLLCMMMGISTGLEGMAYRLDQAQILTMGLTDRDLQEIMIDFAPKIEDIESLVASI